jgi:Peptidase family S41
MPRYLLSLSLTIVCCGIGLAGAQNAPRVTTSPTPGKTPSLPGTAGLDPSELQQALSIIQHRYLDPHQVSGAELNRATLDGLLSRLGRGAMLLSAPVASPTPDPFYREIIDGHIGYLRPGELSRSQVQELDTTLRSFPGKKVDAIVLDLRSAIEANDYAAAAEFASRFVPKGKLLFSLTASAGSPARDFSSRQDPSFSGFMILLVDKETAGAAEAVAGAIRFYNRTIVIGEPSAGRPLDYADEALRDGKILRVAVAQAIPPDQRPLFPKGLGPDLEVVLPPDQKREIFDQSLTKGMASFVFESDRPHLNEAALLAGTNPELDAAAQQHRPRAGEKLPLHDPVLQRAIDLVTSIGVYEKQPGRPP